MHRLYHFNNYGFIDWKIYFWCWVTDSLAHHIFQVAFPKLYTRHTEKRLLIREHYDWLHKTRYVLSSLATKVFKFPSATNENTAMPLSSHLKEGNSPLVANQRDLAKDESLTLKSTLLLFPPSISLSLPLLSLSTLFLLLSPLNPTKSQLMALLLAQTGRERPERQKAETRWHSRGSSQTDRWHWRHAPRKYYNCYTFSHSHIKTQGRRSTRNKIWSSWSPASHCRLFLHHSRFAELWIRTWFTFTMRFRYLAHRLGTFQVFIILSDVQWVNRSEIMLLVWGYEKAALFFHNVCVCGRKTERRHLSLRSFRRHYRRLMDYFLKTVYL